MDVILLERIRNLGHLGDKVSVKSGYARNFLIPYGKAVPATEEKIAEFEARRAELEKAASELLAAAEKRKTEFDGLALVLKRKASEEGKLFGAVSIQDLVDELIAQGKTVERKEIDLLTGPMREVGEYEIEVQLHSDVNAKIKVTVEAE